MRFAPGRLTLLSGSGLSFETSSAASRLDQPQRLEAGHAVAADDEVVVHGDPERPAGLDDLAGDVDAVAPKAARLGSRGALSCSTMIVMTTAKTPSLNAMSRAFSMISSFAALAGERGR